MNENQPSNKSRPTASSKKRPRNYLSASKRKKEKEQRVNDFTKFIDEGGNKSEKQRLSFSHSSGPVAPREGTFGNSRNEEDVMSYLDKAKGASTDQQNGFENEASSSEGVLTQDMAEYLEAIELEHYNNNKESNSCEGSSLRLTQEMMSTAAEDNSVSNPAAQPKSKNNQTNRATGNPQQPLSRMGSINSVESSRLTDEQKKMIEENRLKAIERKKQRRQQKMMMNQRSPSNNDVVATKPHPYEAMRQVSIDSRSTSAATNPSRDLATSSRVLPNIPIAPEKRSHDENNSGDTETSSSGNFSQEKTSTVPLVERVLFYDDKEQGNQKESRRKSAGVTLTQQGFVERNPTKKKKMERQAFPTNDYIADWHRGKKDVKFMKGDVWKSSRPEFDGWLFLVERIDLQHKVHVVKAHAFLKLEKTFIGQQEAAKLEHTGYVLVKKHDSLPSDGYIKLKDLSERMTQDIPFIMHLDNRHLALRYEEDGDIVSYYTKKGSPISSSSNNQLQKPRVCDCFAGGGGMSVGIGKSGFFSEKSYKVDMDRDACETLRANFPESTVFHMDMREFNEKFRRGEINLFESLIDWLHLSPPCQGFSRVNTSGGDRDIQNNECTLACIETVRLLQPSHVTMENVPGILDDKLVPTAERTKRSYLQEYVGGLLSQNYQVRICKKLNAKSCGDPQDRERVIVLGSKKGFALPSPPPPTHGKEPHLKDSVTARDVLSDLECIEPTKDGNVRLNNGSLARGHYSKDTKRVEKHEPDVELKADLPARTVRKKNQMVHYNLKRNVTVLERARLMSFPDEYIFEGNLGSQSDQIGNAIPVCLATAIANTVSESFRLGLHEPPSSS
ncbi:hypothetical protein ACHAWT_006861 [Skeletonema menzelii]